MDDSQQRPKYFAPRPLEDAEVSTENAVSNRTHGGIQIDSGLIQRPTKLGSHQRTSVKIVSSAISFAFLSLSLGLSSALSQDVAAERIPKSDSSEAPRQSAPAISAEPNALPDSPKAAGATSGGRMFPPGMGRVPLEPQTFHDKFMAYAVNTVGPRALVGPAFPAAIRMANPPSHFPAEWRQGAEAFGRNYGDQLATIATLQTGRFIVGAALHEDFRYHPSTSTNFFLRTGHAIGYTFVDRSDDGHARPAVANFVGLAGGSYVGMSYLPTGFNDVTHANQTLVFQLSRIAGSNLGAEFAPDIFRFLAEHHLPRPQIPIPVWWVKR
jgi:hypothetical protein